MNHIKNICALALICLFLYTNLLHAMRQDASSASCSFKTDESAVQQGPPASPASAPNKVASVIIRDGRYVGGFYAPRKVLEESPIFAEQIRSSNLPGLLPEVILPEELDASILGPIFWGLYMHGQEHHSRTVILQELFNEQMQILEASETSFRKMTRRWYSAKPSSDMSFADVLVYLLQHTDALKHDRLTHALAFALNRKVWKNFNYSPYYVFAQLWNANARTSALAVAHYALLLRETKIIESEEPINPPSRTYTEYAWNLVKTVNSYVWSTNYPITIPRDSMHLSLEEYIDLRPDIIEKLRRNSRCLSLTSMKLGDIKGLSSFSATSLGELDLSNNCLTTLEAQEQLATLPHLRALLFSHNQLSQLPSLAFLTLLRRIDASHNRLTSVQGADFERLTNLRELHVNNNLLQHFPPRILSTLSKLTLLVHLNPLMPHNIAALKEAAPEHLTRLVI